MTADSPNEDSSPRMPPPPAEIMPGDAEDFADLLSGQPEPLDARFIPAERVGWWITTGILCGVTFMALVVVIIMTWPPGWLTLLVAAWGVLTTAMLWATLRWPQIAYRHTSYLVTPQGLEIRRGVVWKAVITVPKSRTQHTDVMQGPLQRRYGIATLKTHTAGTENASVALSGLSYGRATRIRDYLIRSTEADAV